MDKVKKPFYKKWWSWLILIILVIGFVTYMSQPATEEYKADAQTFGWLDFAEGKVSGATKVKISGEVSNAGEETLILTDADGIYYVKNEDATKTKLTDGDRVEVYGVYVGDDSETGFPQIVAKLIEK